MGPLDSPPTGSYYLPPLTYGLSLTASELVAKTDSVLPSDPDGRTESVFATESSSGKN